MTVNATSGTSTRHTTTPREDAIAVVLNACLVAGAMADGWAHVNIVDTLEGFFTPWHAVLYTGLTGSAAWIFWLAYQRRGVSPLWWRDGWPAGYRLGALGVLLCLAGGLADLVWHEALGVEVGLEATFSPSHMVLGAGSALIVTSPMRSWWASGGDSRRAVTGVASLALGPMAVAILLTHSSAFETAAPVTRYAESGGQATGLAAPERLYAITGIGSYVVTTLLVLIPVLLAYRSRLVPGAATAVVSGVALFNIVVFALPTPQVVAALIAVLGAVAADAVLLRLGRDDRWRPVTAGAVVPALVWSGHLLGLHLTAGLRWPPEMWTGVPVLTATLGALLGALIVRPVQISGNLPMGRDGAGDPGLRDAVPDRPERRR
jgi:hypothetical protein